MEHREEGVITKQQKRERSIKTGFVLGFVLTVGIGAVQFGYSIGVFNSLMVDFFTVFEIPADDLDFWKSLINSVCQIGAAVGSLTCGPFVNIFGKQKCILGANIILAIGCGMTQVRIKEVLAAGRFIYGLSVGAFSVFVPSFINELTPTELKGPFGSATQILITVGILLSNLLEIPLPDLKDNPYKPGFICDDYWRVLFSLPLVFAAIQTVLLLTIYNYETPKFLK